MALYHAYTQTVADGTATSVVRPSDWNSGHIIRQDLSGNTLGQSSVSGTNIVYQAGNNITLSASTAASAATIVVSAANQTQQPMYYSANNGSASASTMVFANSNGVSFSTGTQGIVASHNGLVQSQADTLYYPQVSADSPTKAPNGFPDRTTVNLSWSNGTRTLTVSPVSGSFIFWSNATKYTKSVAQTVTIADTEGMHYLYFDDSGTLVETTSFSTNIIIRWAFVCALYWDATNKVVVPDIQVELHGVDWPPEVHLQQHLTVGARYQSGLALTVDADQNGSLLTHIEVAGATGIFWDEDIRHNIAARLASANIPVMYMSGSGANWRFDASSPAIVRTTGTGRPAYNQNNAGTWQLTEMTDGSFGVAYVCVGSGQTEQWFVVMGTNEYPDLDSATTAAKTAPTWGVLPFAEFRTVGAIVFDCNNAYTNAVKARIRTNSDGNGWVDWRTSGQLTSNAVIEYAGVAIEADGVIFQNGTAPFGNANGFSFKTSNGSIVGSYTVPSQTADTNKAGTGFTSSTTAGTALVGTLGTNGLSVGVPAWITTFQNDLTSGRAGTGFSSTTTAGTAVVGTLNTNGLSLGVPAYVTTSHATTGRAGTGFTSTTTAGTAIVATLNTNGLSMGVPAYITTFQNDLTSGRAGTGFTSTTTAGTAVVGTLNTNGLSIGVPTIITNALTTARASNDGVGLNSAGSNITWTVNSSGISIDGRNYAGTATTFNGTNISGSITQNSNGLRLDLSVGAGGAADGYNSAQFTNSTANSTMPLVWAGNSNGSGNVTVGLTGSTITMSAPTGGGGGAALQGSGTFTQNTGTIQFANSNGVTFGLTAGQMTASHNGLTVQSADTNKAGTGFTSTTTGGTAVVATLGTNGLSMGVPAYITTYVNDLTSGRAGTGFTSTTTAGTAVVGTLNTNGLSIGVPTIITNALTTARASNDAVGLNTAATNVTWTVNSAGISLNAGAYLTTAAQSNHSHGNPTLALTNLSGTTASASNGLTLSLSAAAQSNQTANLYASGNTTQLSSTAGIDLRSLSFEGAGIASVGVSNGRVLVSVPAGGGGGDGYNIVAMGTNPVGGGATSGATFSTLSGSIYLEAGNNMTLSQTSNSIVMSGADVKWSLVGNTAGTNSSNLSANSIYFSGGPNITLSGNSNTIVISAAAGGGGGGGTESNYFPHKDALWAAGQIGQNSIQVQPLANVPLVSYDRIAYGIQFSQATNSTMTVSATVGFGIYTLNGTALSLLTSGSGSFSINGQGTNSSSANSGPRWATMTMNAGGSFSGDVWVAFRSSTATAGAAASLSNLLASRINSSWSGIIGVGTANSVQSLPGMGFYSATSAALPNSMALSHITGVSSTAQRPQIFWMTNGAIPI